jgi:hypothetical protein
MAAWLVGAAVVLAVAALTLSGPLLGLACLLAAWRGMVAAGYGQSAHELRRATVLVALGFASMAVIFGRAGLPLDSLLIGLFLAVASWLTATAVISGSTLEVGVRSYALPYRPWQRRVAVVTVAAAIGLPALLVLTWAVWRGPAALGLGVLADGLRVILSWVWSIFARILVAVLTVLALAIEPVVVWLRRRAVPPGRQNGGDLELGWAQGQASDWLKAVEVRAGSWPWLKPLGAAVVIGLAVWLIYRYARSASANRVRSLGDRVEDLTPEAPRGKRRGGPRIGRFGRVVGLSPVRTAYRAFLVRLAALGVPRPSSATPAEFGRLARGLFGRGAEPGGISGDEEASAAVADLTSLTGAYVIERYGPTGGLGEETARRALLAWEDLKRRLAGRSK